MVMLALGEPSRKKNCHGISNQDANSYQNTIGNGRKVVRLVKELDLKTSTKAMI